MSVNSCISHSSPGDIRTFWPVISTDISLYCHFALLILHSHYVTVCTWIIIIIILMLTIKTLKQIYRSFLLLTYSFWECQKRHMPIFLSLLWVSQVTCCFVVILKKEEKKCSGSSLRAIANTMHNRIPNK